MRLERTLSMALLLAVAVGAFAGTASAQVTLQQTTGLFNEDPPGAPLPLGRTQYDAGLVLNAAGTAIGEYLRVKDVHDGGLNVAAVTITLFIRGNDPPLTFTLEGSHSFNNGDQFGSVSASGLAAAVGLRFTVDGGTNLVTFFP